MKFDARKTGGSASTSDRVSLHSIPSGLLITAILITVSGIGMAQALYKYRGPDGEWVYTDRAPDTEAGAEVRDLPTGTGKPQVWVGHRTVGKQIRFHASNEFHAPIEVILALDEIQNVELPAPDQSMSWVLPARSETELLQLDALDGVDAPYVSYRFLYLPGDPQAEHDTGQQYRAPFATANKFMVSQAFPVGVTHSTPDSYYAVDISMPIGTDVYAARSGTVFEVASTNFRAGPDPAEEGASANLIRVLHDDGTMGVYAHLNWNTIRVKPGDQVQRGQYIADSGNTGFSTGPHLHFAVLRNRGLRLVSVPIVFEGANGSAVTPEVGQELVAY
ncbi:MAG: M23 family metallopeptidase [Woeseia sp.]